MNSTLGVIEALNGLFLAIEGQADSGPYPYFYGQPLPEYYEQHKATYMRLEKKDENSGKKDIPAGAVYVMLFAMCVNDLIKKPGMIESMLRRPKVFKQLNNKAVLKYAGMDVPAFAQALYNICTENGQKITSADDIGETCPIMLERCLYAAYVYTQVAEYLERINNTFLPVPMDTGLSMMAWINSGIKNYEERTGSGTITVGDTVFQVRRTDFSTAALMLMYYLLHMAYKTGKSSLEIPLREYAKIRKRSTSKQAIQKLKAEVMEQLDELADALGYDAITRISGKLKSAGSIEINGGTHTVENGNIRWNFNQDLYDNIMRVYSPTDVPLELFAINPQTHANAFYFGMYIAQNWRMNEDKMPARSKIAMRILIEKSPKLPSYDEVMKGSPEKKASGNVGNRIIKKVFTDLDALETVDYDFYTAAGEKVENPPAVDYQTFINGYIIVNYEEYPQHPDRVDNKKERERKQRAAKEKGQLKGIEIAAAKTAEKQAQEGQAE
jgi:hypothetical protein